MNPRDPATPNTISVTDEGMTAWHQGRAIYRCPVDRFPQLIARLARQLEISLDATRRGH